MRTLAQAVYQDSELGAIQDLPRAGSALENPIVYDDAARELKALAREGLIEVVSEHERPFAAGTLIDRFVFRRVR